MIKPLLSLIVIVFAVNAHAQGKSPFPPGGGFGHGPQPGSHCLMKVSDSQLLGEVSRRMTDGGHDIPDVQPAYDFNYSCNNSADAVISITATDAGTTSQTVINVGNSWDNCNSLVQFLELKFPYGARGSNRIFATCNSSADVQRYLFQTDGEIHKLEPLKVGNSWDNCRKEAKQINDKIQ